MDRHAPDRPGHGLTDHRLPQWVIHDVLRSLADIDAGRVLEADEAIKQLQERRSRQKLKDLPSDPQRDA